MKKAFQLFDYIITLCNNGKKARKKIEHKHSFVFQYYTGKQEKTAVCLCSCGQWSIRNFGEYKYVLMDPIK